MDEVIKIMWAEDLPLDTRKKIDVFSGLVEVKLKRNSPIVVEEIVVVTEKTFSQGLRSALKADNLENIRV